MYDGILKSDSEVEAVAVTKAAHIWMRRQDQGRRSSASLHHIETSFNIEIDKIQLHSNETRRYNCKLIPTRL